MFFFFFQKCVLIKLKLKKKIKGPRRSPPAQKRGEKRIISPNQHEKRAERVPITGPVANKRKRPISPPTANSKKPGPPATDRNNKIKKRKTSSSGSSDSSGSESDSSYSGSSSDSSHSPNSKTVRRDKLAPERKPVQKKRNYFYKFFFGVFF